MNTLVEFGLDNAIMAALLAVVVALVGRGCRRPALRHTLWLLVLLKLVTPPCWGVDLPGWNRVTRTAAESMPAGSVPVAGYSEDAATIIEGEPWLPADSARPVAATAPAVPSLFSRMVAAVQWDRALIGLWLVGAAVFYLRSAVRIGSFQRLLRHAQPAPAAVQARTEELAFQLGLSRCPRVWLVPVSVSPLLWSAGRPPRLVLPATLLERLEPAELDALLAHELAHLRRGDHWVRWLELLTLGAYWWHPVAWWARREIERAEEQCCDAWVLWSLPGAALTYANTLLKTVDFLTEARPALPPVASGAGRLHTLKRRVTMILKEPLDHRLSWPARLSALLLALVVLPMAPHRVSAQAAASPDDRAPADDRIAARTSDDEPSADQKAAPADVDARLRRLEEKMDKLIDSLKTTRGETAERRSRRAADAERPAPSARRSPRPPRGDDESRAADVAKRRQAIEEAVRAAIDPKRMEQLGKDVEAAVKQGIDPERMERLGKEIEESVKRNLNPERMEQLGKDIEAAVKDSIDPERMEKMGRDIEAAVRRNFDPEQMDRLKKKAAEAKESAREAKKTAKEAKEQTERQRATKDAKEKTARSEREEERAERREQRAERRQERRPAGSADQDVERRLRSLENRLDRVLRDLERPGNSAP